MAYFIRRTEDKKYVARSGSEHSYTANLAKAQAYATREDAEKDRCIENEYIVEWPTYLSPR